MGFRWCDIKFTRGKILKSSSSWNNEIDGSIAIVRICVICVGAMDRTRTQAVVWLTGRSRTWRVASQRTTRCTRTPASYSASWTCPWPTPPSSAPTSLWEPIYALYTLLLMRRTHVKTYIFENVIHVLVVMNYIKILFYCRQIWHKDREGDCQTGWWLGMRTVSPDMPR